jgi:hypothetical protein
LELIKEQNIDYDTDKREAEIQCQEISNMKCCYFELQLCLPFPNLETSEIVSTFNITVVLGPPQTAVSGYPDFEKNK